MSTTLKGIDSFLDVLALIKNPAKYEAKIKELQTESQKYQDVVEAVVKLSEVNDYTKSINQREETSKQALIQAEAQAKAIVMKATEEAVTLGEAARALDKKAKEASKAVTKREETIAILEKELAIKTATLAAADLDLAKRQEALAVQERDMVERKAKLVAALG